MGIERISRREFLERTFQTGVGAIASTAIPPFLQTPLVPKDMRFPPIDQRTETADTKNDLPFWEDIEHFNRHFVYEVILPKLEAFGDRFAEALKPLGFAPEGWRKNIQAVTNVAVKIAESYQNGVVHGLFTTDKEAQELCRTDFYQVASALAAIMQVDDRYERNPEEFSHIIKSYAAGKFRNKQSRRIDELLGEDINQFSAAWTHLGWRNSHNFISYGWMEMSGLSVRGRSPTIELLSGYRRNSDNGEFLIEETIGDNYEPGITRLVKYQLFKSRINDQLENLEYDERTIPPSQPSYLPDLHRPRLRPQKMTFKDAPPQIQTIFRDYVEKHGLERAVPLIKYSTLNYGTFAQYDEDERQVELNSTQITPENLVKLDVLIKIGIGHEFTHALINNFITSAPAEISQPLLLKREQLMGSLKDFTDPGCLFGYPGEGIFSTGELEENNNSWRSPTSAMVMEYPLYQYLIIENRYTPSFSGFMTLINRTNLFLEDVADGQTKDMKQLPVYQLLTANEVAIKSIDPSSTGTFADFYTHLRPLIAASDSSPFERAVLACIEAHLPAFDQPKKHIFYPRNKTPDEWIDYLKKIVIPSSISHLVFSYREADLTDILSAGADSPETMRRALRIYKQSVKVCLDASREELWAQLVGLGLLMRDDPKITPDPSIKVFNLPAVMDLADRMLHLCVEAGVAREDTTTPQRT